MPGRKYTVGNQYRYGFNGKELDKDVNNDVYDYGMRLSDQRLGRFLSVDPLTDEYPELTPFQFSGNSPISTIDLDGLESVYKLPDGSYYRDPYGPSDRLRPPPPRPGSQLMGIHKNEGQGMKALSTTLDNIPVVGSIKGGIEGVVGYDMEGHKLSTEEGLLGVVPYAKHFRKVKQINTVVKAVDKADDVNDATKAVNKIEKAKSTEKAIVKDEGIIFSADLSKTKAKSRSGHSNAGNKQLNEAMQNDPNLKKKVEAIDPSAMDRTNTSNGGRRNPNNTEWDHNTNDPNKLDLRTIENHRKKPAQDPGRKGGWSLHHKKDNK